VIIILFCTAQSSRICIEMDKKKNPQRNDTRKLVELSQKKGIGEFDSHRDRKLRIDKFDEILIANPHFGNLRIRLSRLGVFKDKIK